MRHLQVAVVASLLCLMTLPLTVMARSAQHISVSARAIDGNDAVRTVKMQGGMLHIGVRGSRPFTLIVESSYPLPPEQVLIAMSDGKLYELPDAELVYTCEYLLTGYGLAMAVFADESIQTCAFRLLPAWHKEEADLIPEERPELLPPQTDELRLQEEIDFWWLNSVLTAEREKKREQGKDWR
jgi:hypothetical protein